MPGPKIIAEADPHVFELAAVDPHEDATGIRRTNTGGWAAIKDGRLRGEWRGPGSKARAIRSAGTDAVLP